MSIETEYSPISFKWKNTIKNTVLINILDIKEVVVSPFMSIEFSKVINFPG